MKRVLLLALFATFFTAGTYAQNCQVDSTVLVSGELLSPPLYTDTTPVIATAPACIGVPYFQSVTVNVPDTASVPFGGTFVDLPINSVSVTTSGAVSNLPAGLTYLCNPPNCVFPKNTLGCILIYGTPTGTLSAPDTADLSIAATISSPSFPLPIPINLPGDVSPNAHYYLVTHPAGMCVNSTNQIPEVIASLSNAPNPFSATTVITVEANEAGDFQFDVFDLLGKRVYSDNIRLETGKNRFTFDAGDISNGVYFFSIANGQGRAGKLMIVNK